MSLILIMTYSRNVNRASITWLAWDNFTRPETGSFLYILNWMTFLSRRGKFKAYWFRTGLEYFIYFRAIMGIVTERTFSAAFVTTQAKEHFTFDFDYLSLYFLIGLTENLTILMSVWYLQQEIPVVVSNFQNTFKIQINAVRKKKTEVKI